MAKARKEIDKDAMYQKIMPSSVRAGTPDEAAPAPEKKPATPRPRKSSHAVSISSHPAAPAPITRMFEESTAATDSPSVLEDTHGSVAAPVEEAVKPALVNIMERLIDIKIEVAMDKFHCCTCEHCRRDVTAYALNKLSPRYLVQDPELIAEALEDKVANTQVTTALVQAILKVKANPQH